MPITVNVGELLSTDDDQIRTRGCDPCVALLVIYADTKKCAHFCVSFAGPYTQANINQRLDPILEAHFPLEDIIRVGFTWGGQAAGMGSTQIMNRLAEYFGDHHPIFSNAYDSISSTEENEIAFSNLEVWPFTNEPPLNQYADLV
jgi:hypothetical protein